MPALANHPRNLALTHSPWQRMSIRALGRARRVPTMLSEQEQKLYYWLTAFWAEGRGAVVDLGCFAGGSTARLAEGAAVAGHGAALHAYDRFTADPAVKAAVLYPQGVPAFPGRDIFPLAQRALSPWPAVTLHRGEIELMPWDGGPIEILVVDAAKTARSMDLMSCHFLPHLVPGESLVVQQDLLHWSQPWIAAQMELLRDCFTPVAHAPRDTVVYLCHRVPGMDELHRATTADLSDARMLELLDAARTRLAPLGVAEPVARLQASLLHNPGRRRAYEFQRPATPCPRSPAEPG